MTPTKKQEEGARKQSMSDAEQKSEITRKSLEDALKAMPGPNTNLSHPTQATLDAEQKPEITRKNLKDAIRAANTSGVFLSNPGKENVNYIDWSGLEFTAAEGYVSLNEDFHKKGSDLRSFVNDLYDRLEKVQDSISSQRETDIIQEKFKKLHAIQHELDDVPEKVQDSISLQRETDSMQEKFKKLHAIQHELDDVPEKVQDSISLQRETDSLPGQSKKSHLMQHEADGAFGQSAGAMLPENKKKNEVKTPPKTEQAIYQGLPLPKGESKQFKEGREKKVKSLKDLAQSNEYWHAASRQCFPAPSCSSHLYQDNGNLLGTASGVTTSTKSKGNLLGVASEVSNSVGPIRGKTEALLAISMDLIRENAQSGGALILNLPYDTNIEQSRREEPGFAAQGGVAPGKDIGFKWGDLIEVARKKGEDSAVKPKMSRDKHRKHKRLATSGDDKAREARRGTIMGPQHIIDVDESATPLELLRQEVFLLYVPKINNINTIKYYNSVKNVMKNVKEHLFNCVKIYNKILNMRQISGADDMAELDKCKNNIALVREGFKQIKLRVSSVVKFLNVQHDSVLANIEKQETEKAINESNIDTAKEKIKALQCNINQWENEKIKLARVIALDKGPNDNDSTLQMKFIEEEIAGNMSELVDSETMLDIYERQSENFSLQLARLVVCSNHLTAVYDYLDDFFREKFDKSSAISKMIDCLLLKLEQEYNKNKKEEITNLEQKANQEQKTGEHSEELDSEKIQKKAPENSEDQNLVRCATIDPVLDSSSAQQALPKERSSNNPEQAPDNVDNENSEDQNLVRCATIDPVLDSSSAQQALPKERSSNNPESEDQDLVRCVVIDPVLDSSSAQQALPKECSKK